MACPDVAVTFDIDWAPDWSIALCLDLVRRSRRPATFFVTHASPMLTVLRRGEPLIECGVHPNFLPDSCQGDTPEKVMAFLTALVPGARAVRTHSLVQSTPLLGRMVRAAPGLTVDVSLLLPFHFHLRATSLPVAAGHAPLHRLPYFWEDDLAALTPGWSWISAPPQAPGLKIFDFHPIHVALNTADMSAYQALKSATGGRRLADLAPGDIEPFVNHGPGARSFLEQVLSAYPPARYGTIGTLADHHPPPPPWNPSTLHDPDCMQPEARNVP